MRGSCPLGTSSKLVLTKNIKKYPLGGIGRHDGFKIHFSRESISSSLIADKQTNKSKVRVAQLVE